MKKKTILLLGLLGFVLCVSAVCLFVLKKPSMADSEDVQNKEALKEVQEETANGEEPEKGSSDAPVLVLEQEQVFLSPGERFSLLAHLECGGRPWDGPVEIHWYLQEGSKAVALEQEEPDGAVGVRALEEGEARIQAFVEWKGIPVSDSLSVYVKKNDTRLELSGLEMEKGGYRASLPLLSTDTAQTTASFTCQVYENGSRVEDPRLTFQDADSGCVEFDPGQMSLTAVHEGNTRIVVRYKDTAVNIDVEVYRPVVEIDPIEIETALLYGFQIPEGVEGEVHSVSIYGEEFFQSYDRETSVVTIKKLPSFDHYGEKPVEIETDKGIYKTTAGIYTKILRTKEDLDQLGSWAHVEGEEGHPDTWGGYFVLGNDIAYNSRYQSFCNMEILGAMGACSYGDGNLNGVLCCFHRGFCGVFDGRGYNIDGMEINDECGGLMGVISQNGVFKNVSFTNVRHGGNGGFICSASGGTIENVYIHCVELLGGRPGGNLYSGLFLSTDSIGAARVRNCFVSVDCEAEDLSTTFIYGRPHEGYGILENCVAVGVPEENGWILNTEGTGVRNDCRVYADLASLKYAGLPFSGWVNEFWTLKNGLPYPEKLALPETDESLLVERTETAMPGGALRFDGLDKNLYLSLDEQAVADGAYVDGAKIMIPAMDGAVYTAYIRYIYEPDKKAEITIQVQDEPEKDETVSESGLWDN